MLTFTFTFMHLADAFIQSDLNCIQVTVFTFFYQLMLKADKISIEDLDSAHASLMGSTDGSKAVLVECPLLKPDWLQSRRLFCVRKTET